MRSSSSNLNNVLAIFVVVCLLTISFAVVARGQDEDQQNPPQHRAPAGSGSTPKAWLDAHNEARAEVGVPPLVWNESLVEYAQKYADSRYEKCEFEHSMGPYGENLAMNYEDMEGTDAVKFWCTEKADYDYKTNTCKTGEWECGHYTQVVGRKTTSVGCAKAKCKNNWMFVICSYYPPGNIEGEKPY
ncbi:pathogenesis-related protein 1-like [Neltuma alba]|uniref:pathogenesis-related protein 1-like n=1 Tax=Neltuma alba TaxID=207710 RepID=UPI0010A4A1B9|nr:pathogenesis-related protein 1-like [Prosopis alba]